MAFEIDKTDLKILKLLQENGKITNNQLSERIGMPSTTTFEKVKKLEDAGVIKSYHASLDEKALGLGISAFIMVSLKQQNNNIIDKFIQQVNDIDEIVECYRIIGDFDYILKVVIKDLQAFEMLITDKFNKIEEIKQTKTMIILSEPKNSKVLPVD